MTTFHLFTALPYEIRAQIWRQAFEPRLITLWEDWYNHPGNFCDEPVPAVVQSCREARLNSHYKKLLTDIRERASEVDGYEYLWGNFDTDTFSVSAYCLADFHRLTTSAKHLMVRCDGSLEDWYWSLDIHQVLMGYRGLESLIIRAVGVMYYVPRRYFDFDGMDKLGVCPLAGISVMEETGDRVVTKVSDVWQPRVREERSTAPLVEDDGVLFGLVEFGI